MKRVYLSTLTGFVLGIFCIIGVSARFGISSNEVFLLANLYNRVLMGFVIGAVPNPEEKVSRGVLFGFIISFALFLSTGFRDLTGFFAGIIYGIIIEYVATNY